MSVPYSHKDLHTIQRYRAVLEGIIHSEGQVIEMDVAALPQPGLEALVAVLDPTQPHITAVEETQVTHSQLQSTLKTALDQIEYKIVREQRLKRIQNQDTVTPFETVTHAEAAYGLSAETLRDTTVATPGGAATQYKLFQALLTDLGMERALPESFGSEPIATSDGKPLAPSKRQTLSDYHEHGPLNANPADADRFVPPENRVNLTELAQQYTDTAQSLTHQLKYIRDCAFLRYLHEPLLSILDDPSVPALVWKQPALDVQNNQDPFSIQPDTDDPPTEKLFDSNNLPPHLQLDTDETTDSHADTQTQSALDQFG